MQLWFQNFFLKIAQFFLSIVGKVLLWGILLSILAYVLFKVLKGEVNFFLERKEKKVAQEADEILSSEDLVQADWENKLNAALSNANLPLATRYAFVHILQLLHNTQHIEYSIDKTNHEYYLALKSAIEIQSLYRQLMLRYEFAWYGQYEVKESDWVVTRRIYQDLKQKLR